MSQKSSEKSSQLQQHAEGAAEDSESEDDDFVPEDASESEEEPEEEVDEDEGPSVEVAPGPEDAPPVKRTRRDPVVVDKGTINTIDATKIDVDDIYKDFMGATGDQPNKTQVELETKVQTTKKSDSAVASASEVNANSVKGIAHSSLSADASTSQDTGGASLTVSDQQPSLSSFTTVTPCDTPVNPTKSKPGSSFAIPPKFGRGGCKAAGGGFGAALNAKKNKTSILSSSADAWQKFKSNENLAEELQSHNRGKDGFIERQSFLDRADQRQFEHEKNDRASRRKPL